MQITRRQFVQYVGAAAAAAGVSQAAIFKLTEQLATAHPWVKPKVIFIEGQVCGGCETSILQLRDTSVNHTVLNSVLGVGNISGSIGAADDGLGAGFWPNLAQSTGAEAVTIDDVLFDILDVKLIRIAGSAAGALYTQEVLKYCHTGSVPGAGDTAFDVLVVTGSIPTGVGDSSKIGKNSCVNAATAGGTYYTAEDLVKGLAANAGAVIATGTCASYGGVPAARNANYDAVNARYKNNGAVSVSACLAGTGSVVVKLPNCPVQPNAFYLTIAQYLIDAVHGGSLGTFVSRLVDPANGDTRPKAFVSEALGVHIPLYENTIHGFCPRFNDYGAGHFANYMSDDGCLYWRGCQGINTYAPCVSGPISSAKGTWNDFAQQFCIASGAPCTGCAMDGYPDRFRQLNTYDGSGVY